MKKQLALYILLLLTATATYAQEQDTKKLSFRDRMEHRIIAGFNFGGTTPVPLPNTIRKIEGYWPAFAPTLGYEATYYFQPKWGVSAGVSLELKGMSVKDSVLYFPTIMNVTEGGQTGYFEGTFTGHNKTKIRNTYITIPVAAVFKPNNNWRFRMGGYMAWLLNGHFDGDVSDGYIRNGGPTGEKIIVDQATFDFADDLRRFDMGLQGGAERRVGKHLSVQANLSWGLRSIFPSDFKGMDFPMYNIYVMLGVNYRI
ncbi:outer membrane protein with beta-barrel domain [Chitinophaga skermanii]|uniref:Outer membrane protein with beta-barrel domain n=1 Tax=Chitinophaga skermanii TaxID=331697 RepID=A0A327QUC7_9BACT|nr:porin family protein [Chitinophaga skermanii]RAJ07013.1 outer membrane protein with beta-barrel domain [Chitinophaga skermanii]